MNNWLFKLLSICYTRINMKRIYITSKSIQKCLPRKNLSRKFILRISIRYLNLLFYQPFTFIVNSTKPFDKKNSFINKSKFPFPFFIPNIRTNFKQKKNILTLISNISKLTLMFIFNPYFKLIFNKSELLLSIQNSKRTKFWHMRTTNYRNKTISFKHNNTHSRKYCKISMNFISKFVIFFSQRI